MRSKKWNHAQLEKAVRESRSVREVISMLRLVPAGGNYVHIQNTINTLGLDTSHFTGKGWRKGLTIPRLPVYSMEELLVKNSSFQSFKLKKRLFASGLKSPLCELCGWAKQSIDGRIPLELDHINGDRYDNRIENLRILCPNCHSLQPTHRGRNKGKPGWRNR